MISLFTFPFPIHASQSSQRDILKNIALFLTYGLKGSETFQTSFHTPPARPPQPTPATAGFFLLMATTSLAFRASICSA